MYISKYEKLITKEKLSYDMYELNLNISEIRKKYNVGSSVVVNLQKKYGLKSKPLFLRRVPKDLTDKQKQIVCGTIIADGHLFRNNDKRNAALKICHTIKQEEYLDYKYELLKDFVKTKPTTQISRVGSSVSVYKSFRTLTHPYFTEIHDEIYYRENNRYVKHLNISILNRIKDLGLAIAYMDDGTKHHKCRDFCFECFSFDEQELFASWLKDVFGIKASIIQYNKKNKKGFRTRINKKSVNDFIKIIEPYVLKTMRYKL